MNLQLKQPHEHFQKYRNAMFESHCEYILSVHFEPFFASARNNIAKLFNSLEPSRNILLVEDRPSYQLRFTVLNSLLMTGFRYKCLLFATDSNLESVRCLLSDVSEFVDVIDLSPYGVYELSRNSYNELLKQSLFWKSITASSVLIIQNDALLIEPLPDCYFKYDYIGAPWSIGKYSSIEFPEYEKGSKFSYTDKWNTLQFSPNLLANGHTNSIGNGGLSIRNVRCMNLICASEASDASEAEDVFFARNVQKYSDSLPSLTDAKSFSCESTYSYSYGSHASYKWIPLSEQAKIYERHMKHVFAIVSANSN